MDQIAQQLRSEIHSIEQHIKRTGNRLLVAQWVDELVGPFEQIEDTIDTADMRSAVVAFHHARSQFKINGHLADRIDDILARHEGLVSDLDLAPIYDGNGAEYDGVVLPPDSDPGDTTAADETGSMFFDEDEELADSQAADTSGDDEIPDDTKDVDFGRDDDLPDNAIEFTALNDFGADASVDVEFGRDDEEAAANVDFGANLDGGSDELFSTTTPRGNDPETPSASSSGNGRTTDNKSRDSSLSAPTGKADPSLYAIFAHTVSVDDLAAGLDIVISPEDRTFLDQKLRARLSDRVVAVLRAIKASEKQYILVPRIARASNPTGGTLPLTVKNMAKRYIGLFGDIRDLMRYRNDSMMSLRYRNPGGRSSPPSQPARASARTTWSRINSCAIWQPPFRYPPISSGAGRWSKTSTT